MMITKLHLKSIVFSLISILTSCSNEKLSPIKERKSIYFNVKMPFTNRFTNTIQVDGREWIYFIDATTTKK